MSDDRPPGVLLVGSVPLADAEAVFRAVGSTLGDRVRRIPDGETGIRSNWVGWQAAVFAREAHLEPAAVDSSMGYGNNPRFRVRAGVDRRAIAITGPLGYADVARTSYATFVRLRGEGALPRYARFQVCLPSPLAPVRSMIVPEDQGLLVGPYEARMLAELAEIVRAIPAADLAVQWDVASEFSTLDGTNPPPADRIDGAVSDITARLVRIGERVPVGVALGYHLCYGDYGHKHFREPDDTSWIVRIANTIASGLGRPLDWLHFPVPRERSDDRYFAPLSRLRLPSRTEVYLGCVHLSDGAAGARRRVAAGRKVLADFGVATECGFGRRPPETIPALLDLLREVSAPVAP